MMKAKVKRMMKAKVKRKYWMRFYIGECCLCGKDFSYRERVYGNKPKDIKKRYIYLPLNACCHHF